MCATLQSWTPLCLRFRHVPPGSGLVHYDEGESEAEGIHSNMDMSNPIFQLYEAVRGGRNSQGQLISEPFLQLPSRKDYPDYYKVGPGVARKLTVQYGICRDSKNIAILY